MARILIIDDEVSIRGILREILEQENHEVVEASNGIEAAKKFKEYPFELIITDLVMPGKSGIELIIELQNVAPDIPILAISGGGGITGRFDYLQIAKLIGAKAIMTKPFKNDEVKQKVSSML